MMQRMTIDPNALRGLEEKLRADHGMPGRAYHSFAHVQDCLDKLETIGGLDERERRLLRWALLWHDSIYDPTRGDNEERSAERAASELVAAGADGEDAREVSRLVLLTKGHKVEPADRLGAILVSIDLSILGAEPERYRQYAADIRREYAHVPDDAYRAGRTRVLEDLLEADPIYPDPEFSALYEKLARANMTAEIESLGSS